MWNKLYVGIIFVEYIYTVFGQQNLSAKHSGGVVIEIIIEAIIAFKIK